MSKYTQKDLIKLSGPQLFQKAFTHRGFLKSKTDNEKLEFLGDALLNFLLAEQLFKKHPNWSEGGLTKKRSQLLSGSTLAKIARDLDFSKYLRVQEEKNSSNPRLLAGALEAYTAAVYLKGGMNVVRRWVQPLFKEHLEELDSNYKSYLQEWCQKKHQELPHYVIKKEEGLDHNKLFYIEVFIKDKPLGLGVGASKRKAQQSAAQQAVEKLKIKISPA